MRAEVVAVVLAAGLGTRLRPLTDRRPKPLCPVGNRLLVDLAIERAAVVTDRIAVNVHAGRDQMETHLAGRVHLSIEPELLDTGGGVANLREWTSSHPVLAVNGDSWVASDGRALFEGWDGERVRVLVTEDPARADFDGRWRMAGLSLLPPSVVAALPTGPSSLYDAWVSSPGGPELIVHGGAFFDCGTPADYLAANLHVSGGAPVIGVGAVIDGEVERSVVWPFGVVARGERLVGAIRVGTDLTVQVE